MNLEPAYWWLIAGAVFLAFEAFGIQGIGFLFAGLAAILVGLIVHYDLISHANLIAQFAAFFGITGLLAAVLWKKLKNWRSRSASGDYRNIIGDMATVGKDGLSRGKIGQVSWSGTTMMAELSADYDHCDQGAMVEIVSVKGNKLIVKPVH
jgi:membrane protein implicated in regulation of membrane protease activity